MSESDVTSASVEPPPGDADADGNAHGVEAETGRDANSSIDDPQDSVDRKLCILKLGKWLKQQKLDKELKRLEVPFIKTRKITGQPFAFVFFEDTATKDRYVEILRKTQIFGEFHDVENTKKVATHKRPPEEQQQRAGKGGKRQKTDGADGGEDGGVGGVDVEPRAPRTVEQVVTPWADVPYGEQLERKRRRVLDVLRDMAGRVRRECQDNIPTWARLKKQELACPLLDLIPSPVTSGYRNKNQFTIGLDSDGRPCVGFAMGRVENNVTHVASGSECVVVSPACRAVLQLLQRRVAASGLDTYDKHRHAGFWRQLTVRSFRSGDVMAAVQVDPTGLPRETVEAAYEALTALARDVGSSGVTIHSLLVQEYSGVSNAAPLDCPHRVLHGSEYVHEEMLGLRFRVSPSAFFQVNTIAAELLYGLVRDWIVEARKTVGGPVCVLDVCCGTGTIGLSLASHADRVIGLELDPSAVKDAKYNASLNSLKNAFFLAGKAEEVVNSEDFKLLCHGYHLLAVVDPPRAGLHGSVIKTLRTLKGLTHIVYVSCDPAGLLANVSALTRPESKHTRGLPFVPMRASAIDLFPHTAGVEIVALFHRQPPAAGRRDDAPAVAVAPVAPVAAAADAVDAAAPEEAPATTASAAAAAAPTASGDAAEAPSTVQDQRGRTLATAVDNDSEQSRA